MKDGAEPAGPPIFALGKITVLPNLEQCTHKTGRLWLTVTNYGIIGNQRNVFLRDCETGGLTSSAEYPGGSGVEYLYEGALWVGGIVGNDTLVSVGSDGWLNIREMFPDVGAAGNILMRSKDPGSPHYSPDAVSDQDFIAVYYDTLKDPRVVTSIDPEDGKPFVPLGLKIVQRSYSWATSWGQDWVLLDYTITNIGKQPVKKAYVGLFVDPDIGDATSGKATFLDDYCAFRAQYPLADCQENVNVAYAYDNDGDPEAGSDFVFSSKNPTGALGVRCLRAGKSLGADGSLSARLSFNWWVADSMDLLDWGPQKIPGRQSFLGTRGEPQGAAMRYYYLSNGEIDYDQVQSAIPQTAFDREFGGLWLPPLSPPSLALNIAGGADSRFLLSAGPFDLDPGDSLPVTFAVFVGAAFHTNPANFATNFQSPTDFLNPANILAYKAHLDLSGLMSSAHMARSVFDNDTDTSSVPCRFVPTLDGGYFVYTRRPHGDGIPDFKGPVPPPYPQKIEFSTAEGEVTIRWFGRNTENAIDPISGLKDFEGYAVLMSPDGINYTVVGYFDRVNWRLYYVNRDVNGDCFLDANRWEPAPTRPLTYDEIQNFYAVRWDTCANKPGSVTKPINPEKFTSHPTQANQYPFIATQQSLLQPGHQPGRDSHSLLRSLRMFQYVPGHYIFLCAGGFEPGSGQNSDVSGGDRSHQRQLLLVPVQVDRTFSRAAGMACGGPLR